MNGAEQSLPPNWRLRSFDSLGKVLSGATPSTRVPEFWNGDVAWVTPADLSEQRTPFIRATERSISQKGLKSCAATLIPKQNLVISSRAPIGYVAIPMMDFATNQGCKSLILNEHQDCLFHYYNLCFHVRKLKEKGEGTTFSEISKSTLGAIQLPVPDSKLVQLTIGQILLAADQAIQRLEYLIAKYRRLKTGLMQQLLKCGIDEHGQIRDYATHKFKRSPIGLVPAEWNVVTLGSVALSAIDGPFGSNLKTEHYVTSFGTRVVRLQNIGVGRFEDGDRVFVSNEHAYGLRKHTVSGGDLLIAALGDERHPLARSCLYPSDHPSGIVKADCFRFRLIPKTASHGYVMNVLNSVVIRPQVEAIAQGVTRERVNLTKVKALVIGLPLEKEQEAILAILDAQDHVISAHEQQHKKFRGLKTAIMRDLLTGRTSLEPMIEAEAAVARP